MSKEEENQIEAILFASGKGVTLDEINNICNYDIKLIKKSIKNLQEEYSKRDSSLQIVENNDKWKLTVKSKYLGYVEKIVSETELSQSILKTLAVIAFKSPVLQSEIIDMRGVCAYDHVKELVQNKFITKDPEGRSFILKITDKFYNYFDVEDDDEIRDVFSKLKSEQEQKLGELEVVDIDSSSEKIKEIKEDGEVGNPTNLSNLEIVDASPEEVSENLNYKREEIFQRRKEQREEDKSFLSDINSKIDELSKRVDENKIEKKSSEDDYPPEDLEENADENIKKDELDGKNSDKEKEIDEDYI